MPRPRFRPRRCTTCPDSSRRPTPSPPRSTSRPVRWRRTPRRPRSPRSAPPRSSWWWAPTSPHRARPRPRPPRRPGPPPRPPSTDRGPVSASGGTAAREPSAAVRRALAPLLEDPATTAVVTDFDGTLAPIVDRPGDARPLDGTAEVLERLAQRFGVVAVVSGRPVSFLVDHLTPPGEASRPGSPQSPGPAPPRFVGLYGLEWSAGDGTVGVEPGVERWRPVVGESARRLRSLAPEGVMVEAKGLTVTLH